MIGRRRLLLAVTTGGALALVGVQPAHASCVAPEVSLNGRPVDRYAESSPAPVALQRGQQLLVEGRWFRDGCEDGGGVVGFAAIRATPSDPESPQRGVQLKLEQAGRSWVLGAADAGPRDQQYSINWRATVPADCADGPATLTMGPNVQIAVTVGE